MRKKHPWRRLCRSLLTLALALCLMTVELAPALAVTQAEIDGLKEEAAGLKTQKQELEKQLDALADDKAAVLSRQKKLDEQISNTSAQIQNVEAQITAYEGLITQTEAELADAEQREEAQYELFCKRVRAMEERGEVSYWSVLFGATSFSDMLTRLNDVNEIMDADQKVIDDLRALQQEITEKKTTLEASKAESEAAKSELVSKKKELDQQRQQAIALVKEIEANEADYQSTIDQLAQEEEDLRAEALRLSKKLEEEQAAQGKPAQSNPGGYIWPVDSRYITSTVGGRTSPGGIGSTNHKGTDIGRVGYTSKVYASKAGTVIVSQYSNSYGHYVVVSHGPGNTTLYAHLSSRSVSVGQYVNQGDVLGITGSTGHSTGPHLHFEVTENGVLINPLSHGAEPRMGYLTGYTLSSTA